jgi:hypothetical protein
MIDQGLFFEKTCLRQPCGSLTSPAEFAAWRQIPYFPGEAGLENRFSVPARKNILAQVARETKTTRTHKEGYIK